MKSPLRLYALVFFVSIFLSTSVLFASSPSERCGARSTNSCTDSEICLYGTTASGGIRVWTSNEFSSGYVREARKRSLNCNVGANVSFSNILAAATEPPQTQQPKMYRLCSSSGLLVTREDVRAIQKGLRKRRIFKGYIDGIPGKKTCRSLSLFLKVEASGKSFGGRELVLIKKDPPRGTSLVYQLASADIRQFTDFGAASVPVTPATPNLKSAAEQCFSSKKLNIEDQNLLRDLSFYKAKIDGIMGSGSQKAISQAKELLGPWGNTDIKCFTESERDFLSSIRRVRLKFGHMCNFSTFATKNHLFEIIKGLKTEGLFTGESDSLSSALEGMSSLESNLKIRNFYGQRSSASTMDCWLDAFEVTQLKKMSTNRLEAPSDINSDTSAISNPGSVKPNDKKTDSNVLKSCDRDPLACSVVQLCGRAAVTINGDKAWSDDTASTDYVALAKSMGVTCGVALTTADAKEPTCADDPALCSVVQLCSNAVVSINGEKAWSTDARSADYVALARSTGVTCGVKPKPVVVAKEPTCADDPALCSVVALCQQATGTNTFGAKFWRMDAELQAYVETAKMAGVSCGVAPKVVEMAKVETCEGSPQKCSIAELCQRATSFETGSLGWSSETSSLIYAEFAQKAGISCGVAAASAINNLINQNQTTRGDKKERTLGAYSDRKALVIGNSQYSQQTPLKNPRSDAELIANSLEQIGFEVELAFDLTRRDLGRAITAFSSRAMDADISLFYFAGHGIEIDNQNYLVPTDAIMDDPAALKYDVIDLREAIDAAAKASRLSLVMVDACRDNPFNVQVAGLNRSLSRGLKVIETDAVASNQIVSFAAESGRIAEDGTGYNSPYATIFSNLVVQPNLEVGKMFRLLSDEVAELTAGRQIPISRTRLSGEDIFFLTER